MHSQRNSRESRDTDKVRSCGCFPGSHARRRPDRSIGNGWIATAGFNAEAKTQKISDRPVGPAPTCRRQSSRD